jgi:hypothetical protein
MSAKSPQDLRRNRFPSRTRSMGDLRFLQGPLSTCGRVVRSAVLITPAENRDPQDQNLDEIELLVVTVIGEVKG